MVSLVAGVVGVAQFLLGLRFVLKLFGANAAAPFADWIYDTSAVVLAPFRGIFPTETIDGVYQFEFATLFAVLAYAFAGYLLTEFIAWVDSERAARHTRPESRAQH